MKITPIQLQIGRLLAVCIVLTLAVSCRPDRTPPTIEATYPQSGATGVPTNVTIQVTFSEAMDLTTAEAACQLAPASTGTFSWANLRLSFKPDSNLLPQTHYTFTVDTGAQDLAGNHLESPSEVSFLTGDSASALVSFYMMGRSVMHNWFAHWDSDPYVPYVRGRFNLTYHELQAPPDMVSRVNQIIDSILSGENPVVFFKFCFEDFIGGDSAGARERLDQNQGIVQQVYDKVVTSRGLRLIVGNALPQVASATDQWLVWSHHQYNQWLSSFAAQHSDVNVFDLYGVLADNSGNLKAAYATSSTDSHPNDAGYVALDATFFPFLEQHY